MPTKNERDLNELCELTGLPTASGQEHRVVAWVEQWAKRHKRMQLRRDEHGNLLLKRTGVNARKPIVFAAHMDHPAMVVRDVRDGRVEAEFRGGVHPSYFRAGTRLLLHHDDAEPQHGRLTRYIEPRGKEFPRVEGRFDDSVEAAKGDVVRWALPASHVRSNYLHAPACDDLAGVAAALAVLGQLVRQAKSPDVRVLLTRAEEVGFVGAMAACRSGILPSQARIVALENSKSYADSPLGGGPIVRVGDKTSTFDPELTYRVAQVATHLAEQDKGFRWQRKLMPGGTCEASAYQALGYTATCVCLPLGNYHNMNERTGKVDSEQINFDDYRGLVRLLYAIARDLDTATHAAPLTKRLNALYRQRKALLRE
ncbi:MAG: M20/M25/M40 family metallo-hydrolase [Phycisphaeraceae bacterium]